MKTIISIFCAVFFLSAYSLHAQESPLSKKDTTSFYEMSLEQLMNVEISVASRKALTPRESPGIVTLISEDEIKNSGAQDLMDVLKLVPGFDFAVDVEGAVSLGIRGNWAHEGKMLLLIDGQEMNESLYSSLQFGNHYPIEQIKKIEIIRGPGSAMYGGNAEYAVINIITKNDKDFTGISAVTSVGEMKKTFGRRNLSVSAGQHFGDVAVNIGALMGEGNRSDQDYTDYFGEHVNIGGKQKLNPSFLEAAISYKEFSFRGIADIYHTTMVDGYNHLLSRSYNNDFTSYYFEAKYKLPLGNKISLVPRFNFKQQTPWNYTGTSTDGEFEQYNRTSYQPRYNLTCYYDLNEHLNFNAGGEYFIDRAEENTQGETFNTGERSVSYNNTSFFAQGLWSNPIANVTIGARLSDNSQYQSSFVPRIGITKVINRLHAKLLFSKAYRAPGIENIDRSINIKPENTTVSEFETGYQFGDIAFFSANFYDITTHDPIVYYYDNGDGYKNYGTSGTRGLELDFRLKGKLGYAGINYSFYTTRGKKAISDYSVSENSAALLAFPAHKINLSGSLKVTQHFSLSGSLSWNCERYDFISLDTITNQNITQKYNPQLFAGIYFNFPNILMKGFSAGFGCNNLLDEREIYIQPYNSNHAPLPGPSREIRVRISYEMNFSKK
jgi:outer membrane receptor for ferrienterochelin and colicin